MSPECAFCYVNQATAEKQNRLGAGYRGNSQALMALNLKCFPVTLLGAGFPDGIASPPPPPPGGEDRAQASGSDQRHRGSWVQPSARGPFSVEGPGALVVEVAHPVPPRKPRPQVPMGAPSPRTPVSALPSSGAPGPLPAAPAWPALLASPGPLRSRPQGRTRGATTGACR